MFYSPCYGKNASNLAHVVGFPGLQPITCCLTENLQQVTVTVYDDPVIASRSNQ